jgi:outer membrane lipoprotein-sorting protein
MKYYYYLFILFMIFSYTTRPLGAQVISAKEIVRKADERFNGEKSSYSVMSMTLIRPSWKRTIAFKSWTLGRDYALTLITSPASEAGQVFLKRNFEMWSFNPAINRLIKLPPSMMSQGWMGSDYTNDDILRESSVVDDYKHTITGEEVVDGILCYKILLTAREDASIVWGKQIRWIDKKDFLFMKAELYDEDGYLVRTEAGSEIKNMDGRRIPTKIVMVPHEEPDNQTILEILEIKFNIPVEDSFFSQQNMKRVR